MGIRLIAHKFHFGDYRFQAELDTGAEVGEHQLMLWYCTKVDITTLPLSQFTQQELLAAIKEPYHSQLSTELATIKSIQKKMLEEEISQLQQSWQRSAQPKQKMPRSTRQQIKRLRRQINQTLRDIEQEFLRTELLPFGQEFFDLSKLQRNSKKYHQWQFLRSFYFEEANYDNIKTFCYEFATVPIYREEIMKGERRWCKRNALFTRNLLPICGRYLRLKQSERYERNARLLFHWLDKQCENILALPQYQRLLEIDSMFLPDAHHIDALIRPAIELLNQVPGLVTHFSCQGVSGKITYDEYELLTCSPHDEYAYVTIERLSYYLHDLLISLLSNFPAITIAALPYYGPDGCILRSTGNNILFREQLMTLAQSLRHIMAVQPPDIEADTSTVTYWETPCYPLSRPLLDTPGGLLPSRLHWLCQPEQIEQTLSQLAIIDAGAQDTNKLPDKKQQKLNEIKQVIIQQAYQTGTLNAFAYCDGSSTFGQGYYAEMAAASATEGFLERLEFLIEQHYPNEKDDVYDHAARQLYRAITGYELQDIAAIQLEKEQVETFILSSLNTLIGQAQQQRRPIATADLQALFMLPDDLIEIIYDQRWTCTDWDMLSKAEEAQLDPEGASIVLFQHSHANVHFTFSLPFRTAERFLRPEHLEQLKAHPYESTEIEPVSSQQLASAQYAEQSIETSLYTLGINSQFLYWR
ncbi:MAG TPA: hypothetical protein VL461_03435 [Dictyobacter sp.]|nr:hypothetical protein [Dictyobacter sp.]